MGIDTQPGEVFAQGIKDGKKGHQRQHRRKHLQNQQRTEDLLFIMKADASESIGCGSG